MKTRHCSNLRFTFLLISFVVIIIILTSFSDDFIKKAYKFTSAQSTYNNTINLEQTLGTPLYHSSNSKLISLRVIDTSENLQTESTVMEKGIMTGIGNVSNIGTFIETYKTNKIVYGQGKGIISSEKNGNNDLITWKSYDIGTINPDRSKIYHGIIFFIYDNTYSNNSMRLLDNTAALYTTKVDTNGSTLRQMWQWK